MAKSGLPPRRRVESGSNEKIATRSLNNVFKPLTNDWSLPSLRACKPYSLCISKIKLTAFSFLIRPARMSRVKNVLPVPVLPKMPLERSVNRSRSRHTGVCISRGEPILKYFFECSCSSPKIRATSLLSAS